VHFTLTQGRPVLPPERVPSLVDADGRFLPKPRIMGGAWRFRMNLTEVVAEFAAQVERLLAAGVTPTHADSHHHVASYPQAFWAKARVMKAYGIARMRSHRCWGMLDPALGGRAGAELQMLRMNLKLAPKQIYYAACDAYLALSAGVRTPTRRYSFIRLVTSAGEPLTQQHWRRYLRSMGRGISELTVHPGYLHAHPEDSEEWRIKRTEELRFLTDPETMLELRRCNVKLMSYSEL